jgi:hypothetical protein
MVEEIETMKQRVIAAREWLAATPAADSDQPGPADPKTGERWDRYNVLGHMAEILPYWIGELTVAMDDGAAIGREPGSAERRAGIAGGRAVGEAALRRRVDAGLAGLVSFLDRLSPADLDRTITMRNRGEQPLRWVVENMLVAHVEEHCSQLASLG